MKFGLAFALTVIATPCLADVAPGYATMENTAQKDRPLALSIWYPSENEATTEVGGNAVFTGSAASVNAPIPSGPLPLIVVSHGGLRSAEDSGAWLASSLAQAGLIVVEVGAPRPSSAAAAVHEIWERPRDISRALDTMLDDSRWSGAVDTNRITVVGYALGGTAALSVVGANLDADQYAQSCDGDGVGGPDCAWYAAQGVTQNDMRGGVRSEPLHDARVTSAVAVMPEYLSAIEVNEITRGPSVLTISLGQNNAPHAQIRNVAISNATAFDAFAVCTKAGPAILSEEEDDAAICGTSPEGRNLAHMGRSRPPRKRSSPEGPKRAAPSTICAALALARRDRAGAIEREGRGGESGSGRRPVLPAIA